jgi:hypothetical protein
MGRDISARPCRFTRELQKSVDGRSSAKTLTDFQQNQTTLIR